MIRHSREHLRRFATLIFFVLLLGEMPVFAGDGNDIEIEVVTDRATYQPGAPVQLLISKCNPTASPITVTQSCPCCDFSLEVAAASGPIVAQAATSCLRVRHHRTHTEGHQPAMEPGVRRGDCLLLTLRNAAGTGHPLRV